MSKTVSSPSAPLRLAGVVGRDNNAWPGDLRAVKSALRDVGFYEDALDPDLGPWTTDALFEGIKAYQKSRGLAADGLMRPDGETQRALNGDLVQVRAYRQTRGGQSVDVAAHVRNPPGGGVAPSSQTRAEQEEPSGFARALADLARRNPRPPRNLLDPFDDGADDALPSPYLLAQVPLTRSANDAVPSVSPEVKHNLKNLQLQQKMMSAFGADLGARFLGHFLEGSGEDIRLSRNEFRSYPLGVEMEQRNERRFTDMFVSDDGKERLATAIINMEDGETKSLSARWDAKTEPSANEAIFSRKACGFYLGLGRAQLKSRGDFVAFRIGDRVLVKGDIFHNVEDGYDFQPEDLGYEDAAPVIKAGLAKPFKVRASWKRGVENIYDLSEGRPKLVKEFWWDQTDGKN